MKTDTIHIALDAGTDARGTALYTLAHETTHFIREWSPEKFEALSDFVGERMGSDVVKLTAEKVELLRKLDGFKDMTVAELNDAAHEEVIADAMETILSDGTVMEDLATYDKSIWAKVKKFIVDLIEKIKKAYAELSPNSQAAKVLRETVDDMSELQRMWAEGVIEAGERKKTAAVTRVNGEKAQVSDKVYSFAGRNAKTADMATLDEAERRLENGDDAETVRRETGWFKGYDGMWRFEIDDSGMTFKLQDNVPNYMTVGEMIRHPKLFRSYPDLAHVDIVFQGLDGKNGSYNDQFNTINIDYSLKNQPEKLKKVLLHELQHAIQARESFASGASVGYWNQQIEAGYDARTALEIQKQKELEGQLDKIKEESPQFYKAMMELDKITPTVPRGKIDWETLEQIEPDPPEWEAYDHRREELERKFGEHEVWDFMDLQYDLSKLKGNPGRTPSELYFSTAGEIEARDTADRTAMTSEERKNTRPDIDREDVVFAEDARVSYFAKNEYDGEKAGIHDQIRNSQSELNKMPVVVSLTVPRNVGKAYEAGTWAIGELQKRGYQADRKGFGKIFFDPESIRDAMKYLDTDAEKVSIIAIYNVLKQGIQIGEHGNHKTRGKHTITFAAPVELNGIRGNMAVVVNARNNKYYVHRILMPDGSIFKFDTKQNNAEREMQRGVPEGSLANATSSASKHSIAQPNDSVNRKFSISEDSLRGESPDVSENETKEAPFEAAARRMNEEEAKRRAEREAEEKARECFITGRRRRTENFGSLIITKPRKKEDLDLSRLVKETILLLKN